MRNRFWADFMLYVAALWIAFVIWLIAKQGDTETRLVTAGIRLKGISENVEYRILPPSAEVNLIFPKTFLNNVLEPGVVRIEIPCEGLEGQAGIGEFTTLTYPLLPTLVDTRDLPPSVRVLGIAPEKTSIEARLYTVEAEVVGKVKGRPKDGFEVKTVQASPARVRLTGSPSALKALGGTAGRAPAIETFPLDIEGASSGISGSVTLSLSPALKLAGSDRANQVEVIADIREQDITRTIANVPILYEPLRTNLKVAIRPAATTLRVKGPRSMVEKLNEKSFRFVPNAVPNEEAGATNILTFLVRPLDEKLAENLVIESEARTFTLLFEDKNSPPSSRPADPLLYLPPKEREALLGILDVPARTSSPSPSPAPASASLPDSSAARPAPSDEKTSPSRKGP